MRYRYSLIFVSVVVTVGLYAAPNTLHTALANEPTAQCTTLESADFSKVLDAPTRIIEAVAVHETSDIPGFCEVSGYVAPSVGFLLSLPSKAWNGKFLELGCGGFCGSMDIATCADPLRKGYACIVSDNGHKSTMGDALWSYNNLEAEIDHAYRAAHVTALAGKAIVERYYGEAPKRSYFMGGSTGGREAMIEAQRFPWDFNGIVALVPSLSETGIFMNLLWGNRVFTNRAGDPLFSQADLAILHRAVVARCDLNDGIKDGLIGDPRVCSFDPAELRCAAIKTSECLTGPQIDVAKKIYSGALTSKGDPIYMPGALKGSELTWLDWFSRLFSSDGRAVYKLVQEEFRYSAFQPSPGLGWKPEDFDFDRDYMRLGISDALFNAVNPDLRKFKAAGGKLLAAAGWSDAGGMPLHTVDYYETAERVMGGRQETKAFFRLFMIPGMGHGDGDGAYVVDWLSYLESWVERGLPPDKLIGSHVKLDDLNTGNPEDVRRLERRLAFPLDPATVEFSRPLYPYPTVAKYLGHGDPKDSASFGPVGPK